MAERFAAAFRACADAHGLTRDQWVYARLQRRGLVRVGFRMIELIG